MAKLSDRVTAIESSLTQAHMAINQLRFDISVADRRSDGNSARIVEAHKRIDDYSDRVHRVEDLFLPGNALFLLEQAVWEAANQLAQLRIEVDLLKQARAAGDASD